jgi:hypothetical protein
MRLARQGVLTRKPRPLWLTEVVPAYVLREVEGRASVMADQLGHLIDVAPLPNVDPLAEELVLWGQHQLRGGGRRWH